MGVKIIAAALTAIIDLAIGVGVFFALLLAMNGYSESDATFGLAAYILLALLVTILMATASFFAAGALMKRGRGPAASAAFSVFAFAVAGGIFKVGCAIIGIGVAEMFRTT